MSRAMKVLALFGLPFVLMLIGGCAGLGVGREPPSVSLQSFRAVPTPGAAVPGFEIGLLVLNPNPEPLRLQGVAYSISLAGQPLLDGVGNDLPVIEGYGQATVTLNAAVNVLGGIRLLNRLMRQTDSALDYEFTARLDPEGFARDIRISESGRVDLASMSR